MTDLRTRVRADSAEIYLLAEELDESTGLS